MLKCIQNIITKGLVVYLITIAVCFKIWDIAVVHNTNYFNYVCNAKGQLFESATPGSKVFVRKQHETCINGENL
jgi:predicted permease